MNKLKQYAVTVCYTSPACGFTVCTVFSPLMVMVHNAEEARAEGLRLAKSLLPAAHAELFVQNVCNMNVEVE